MPGRWAFPLFCEEAGDFIADNFDFVPDEYLNRDNKGDEVFTLGHPGEELFLLLLLLLCLQNVFMWTGDVIFYIYVHPYDINNCVSFSVATDGIYGGPPINPMCDLTLGGR